MNFWLAALIASTFAAPVAVPYPEERPLPPPSRRPPPIPPREQSPHQTTAAEIKAQAKRERRAAKRRARVKP